MSVPPDIAGRRIGLLTASASRLGGGVFEAVVGHANLVRSNGAIPVVVALTDHHSEEDRPRFGECEVIHVPVRGPRQIGYAPDLPGVLIETKLDCLHLHGIWMYPSRAGALWARATGRPYLISPHGMLDPWILARGRWKKALARIGYERDSWRSAATFHALTGHEAADIAAATGRTDSVIIANPAPELEVLPVEAGPRGPEFAYLGRIHPKKNLKTLVAAWNGLASAGHLPADARLTIAGWGDPHDIADLRQNLAGAPPSLQFVGPLFGTEKAELLARSRALVLPSLSEGLPMVVLEAWAAGTPLLMSEHCHLPEGFAAGAAIDCGTDTASVTEALGRMIRIDPESWRTMSDAAIGLARGPFAARTIAARWSEVYARAIAGHPVQTA